ncbi:MAG TPA: DUF4276 family protein [Pseudonocardia sp.]|uniref:DUF4276 family protein n=1 Tax=Pseudonocardia sp. TaxID=60912 RepID=UPI002F403D73
MRVALTSGRCGWKVTSTWATPWCGQGARRDGRADRDGDDCITLRRKLDDIAEEAGFTPTGPSRMLLNRLAIEELEAWFLGDIPAVVATYPRVPLSVGNKQAFRNPDKISGGTWEAFWRLLKDHGYHKVGLPKTLAAAAIAENMDVEKNESRSFQVFRDGLRRFVETEVM